MCTKERAKLFQAIMEQVENLIGRAERLGWDEINSYEDCNDERAKCGWAMQGIASHMLWWMFNSSDYADEWEEIEKGCK